MGLTCALCRSRSSVNKLRYVVNGTDGDADYPAIIVPYDELERIYEEAMYNEDGNLINAVDNGTVEIESGVIVFYSPEGERVLPDGPEYDPRYNPRPTVSSNSPRPGLVPITLPMGMPAAPAVGLPTVPANPSPRERAEAARAIAMPALKPSTSNSRGASRRGNGAPRPSTLRIPNGGRA